MTTLLSSNPRCEWDPFAPFDDTPFQPMMIARGLFFDRAEFGSVESTETETADPDTLEELPKADLINHAIKLGVPTYGTKADITARILAAEQQVRP